CASYYGSSYAMDYW
nr:immunoglobulin heavy chain junction region [Mus musculus]